MSNNQSCPTGVFGSLRKRLTLPGLKAHLLFWPLMAAGFLLDVWTKAAVFEWLKQKPGYNISVIDGFLRLVLAENAGAAFGLFQGQRYKLIAASIFAMIVIMAEAMLLAGKLQQSGFQLKSVNE